MKRSNAGLIAAAILVTLATAAVTVSRAQELPPALTEQPAALTASGIIVSTGTDSLVIKQDDGVQVAFVIDKSTALPPAMAKGDRVTVDYTTPPEGGRYKATTVAAESPAMPPDNQGQPAGSAPAAGQGPPAGTASGDTGTTPEPDRDMPRTASILPLLSVVGVLALGIGLGMRRMARARA